MKLNMTQQVSLKLVPIAQASAQAMATKLGLSLYHDSSQSDTNPDMPHKDMMGFLNPSEEDYIYIPVRALSATAVQSDTIDFGYQEGKALKEAVDKFDDLPILKDHIFSVDGWVGRTQDCFWDETTPGAPPGVTLMMKIDAKADPKTARGLLTGMLDSVSVTIQFGYVKSHPNMSDSDFIWKMGEIVDGKIVQALVTEVKRCYELSVVWQGADVYAKQVQKDGIHTPGLSHKPKCRCHQCNHPKEEIYMKTLAQKLGLTGESFTEEQLVTALDTALTAAKAEATTKVTELDAQVTTLKADLATKDTEIKTLKGEISPLKAANDSLKTEVESLRPKADLGDTFLTEQRTEATRLYSIVAAGKPDASITKLIAEAGLEAARGFIATFGPQAEKIAPLKCNSCGSTSLSRRASTEENLQGATPSFVDKAKAKNLANTVKNMH